MYFVKGNESKNPFETLIISNIFGKEVVRTYKMVCENFMITQLPAFIDLGLKDIGQEYKLILQVHP